MYVMVDFNWIGFAELWARGKRSNRELQKEKFLHSVGLDPKIVRFVVRHDIHHATAPIRWYTDKLCAYILQFIYR